MCYGAYIDNGITFEQFATSRYEFLSINLQTSSGKNKDMVSYKVVQVGDSPGTETDEPYDPDEPGTTDILSFLWELIQAIFAMFFSG